MNFITKAFVALFLLFFSCVGIHRYSLATNYHEVEARVVRVEEKCFLMGLDVEGDELKAWKTHNGSCTKARWLIKNDPAFKGAFVREHAYATVRYMPEGSTRQLTTVLIYGLDESPRRGDRIPVRVRNDDFESVMKI